MSIILLLSILSICSAFISAGGWFYASLAEPWEPLAYLGGAPEWVRKSIAQTNRGNRIGAIFAGCAVLFQAIGTMIEKWQA